MTFKAERELCLSVSIPTCSHRHIRKHLIMDEPELNIISVTKDGEAGKSCTVVLMAGIAARVFTDIVSNRLCTGAHIEALDVPLNTSVLTRCL